MKKDQDKTKKIKTSTYVEVFYFLKKIHYATKELFLTDVFGRNICYNNCNSLGTATK